MPGCGWPPGVGLGVGRAVVVGPEKFGGYGVGLAEGFGLGL